MFLLQRLTTSDMPTTVAPDLRRKSLWGDLLRGATLPFLAVPLLFRPRLFRLSVVSALVTAATLVGVAWAALRGSRAIADWLISGSGTWSSIASVTLTGLSWVVLFAVGAVTIPNLVLAPLQDPLSEATEALCVRAPHAPATTSGGVLHSTLVSLGHTLSRLGLMALGLALLFPLHLVPGVGSGLWLVLSTLWSAFWLAVEQLSNPMARHLRPFGEVVATLKERPGLAVGFGGVLSIILWVPVVNFFLMPVAVVAGTLMFCGLEAGHTRTSSPVGPVGLS